MTMKKVLLLLMLTAVGMTGLKAQNTNHTNINENLGNSSHIDWGRILDDYRPNGRMVFFVGELAFEAVIRNTKTPYSIDDVSKVVKGCMDDLGITEGVLEAIDKDIAEHKEISAAQWHDLALKALDMAARSGVNPLNSQYTMVADGVKAIRATGVNVGDAINTGMLDICEILAGKIVDQMAENLYRMAPEMVGKVSKQLVTEVMLVKSAAELGWNLEDMLRKYHAYDREDYNRKMLQRQMLKELFYKKCEQRLEQSLEDYYKDGEWIIESKCDVTRNKATFFDVPVYQQWKMVARLSKVSGKNSSRYGKYVGRMELKAIHEHINRLDSKFKDNIILASKTPLRLLDAFFIKDDKPLITSSLGDKILEGELTLNIEKGVYRREVRFLGQLEDYPAPFELHHLGLFQLQHGLYKKGHINLPYAHAEVMFQFDYYGQPGELYGRNPEIWIRNQKNTNYYDVFTPIMTIHGDLTSTMHNFLDGGPILIRQDKDIFAPLEKKQGWIIRESDELDRYRKGHYQSSGTTKSAQGTSSLHASIKRSNTSSGTPVNVGDENDEEIVYKPEVDAEPSDEPPYVYDWKSSMSDDLRTVVERGEKIVASGKLPKEYAYLLPEGLNKENDMVFITDSLFMLTVKVRDGLSLLKLSQRVKSHGFKGDITLADKQFDGNGNGKEVMVSFVPETDYLVVLIEDEKVSEAEQTASKIERLTKRMEEINKEIQAHPEKAAELQEEILDISIELQEESLKIQEKMLNQ